MFVHYKIESVPAGFQPPVLHEFAVVLDLDNVFFHHEPALKNRSMTSNQESPQYYA